MKDFIRASLQVTSFLCHLHKVVVLCSASVYEINRDLKKALEGKEAKLAEAGKKVVDAESEKVHMEKKMSKLKEELIVSQAAVNKEPKRGGRIQE